MRVNLGPEDIRGSPQSKRSHSPKRTIYFLQGKPQIERNSPSKQQKAVSPIFKRAMNQNQSLREQMYGLLVDLPEYMSSKSIGVTPSHRNQVVNEAMTIMNRLLRNEQIISRYQSTSQKLRQSMKLVNQIKFINKSIREIYSNEILQCTQKSQESLKFDSLD